MAAEGIVGAICAASFFVGLLLHRASSEELETILHKIKHRTKIGLSCAIILGLLLSAGLQTDFAEALGVAVFALGVAVGSFLLSDNNYKESAKSGAKAAIAFLVPYFLALQVL